MRAELGLEPQSSPGGLQTSTKASLRRPVVQKRFIGHVFQGPQKPRKMSMTVMTNVSRTGCEGVAPAHAFRFVFLLKRLTD